MRMAHVPMPLVFAHRGASTQAPENSLAAFSLAVREGADGIECDTQLTADGQVIILHDDTLDATTTGRGPVRERSLAQLGELRLREQRGGSPTDEPIPTLATVLERFGHGPHLLNVEIKSSRSTALAAKIAEMVIAQGSAEFVLLSSFDVRALAYVNDQYKGLRRAFLYPPSPVTGMVVGLRGGLGWITTATALGCEAIHPHWRLATTGMIERAHALALNVNVWTTDDPKLWQTLAHAGVDGIITNNAAAAKARFSALR